MSPAEILLDIIETKEAEIKQLYAAYAILCKSDPSMPPVRSEPAPAPLPAASPVTVAEAPSIPEQTPAKPQYMGPRCSACGAKMYASYRTMPSGAMVSLMKCNDSACGNEIYQ